MIARMPSGPGGTLPVCPSCFLISTLGIIGSCLSRSRDRAALNRRLRCHERMVDVEVDASDFELADSHQAESALGIGLPPEILPKPANVRDPLHGLHGALEEILFGVDDRAIVVRGDLARVVRFGNGPRRDPNRAPFADDGSGLDADDLFALRVIVRVDEIPNRKTAGPAGSEALVVRAAPTALGIDEREHDAIRLAGPLVHLAPKFALDGDEHFCGHTFGGEEGFDAVGDRENRRGRHVAPIKRRYARRAPSSTASATWGGSSPASGRMRRCGTPPGTP